MPRKEGEGVTGADNSGESQGGQTPGKGGRLEAGEGLGHTWEGGSVLESSSGGVGIGRRASRGQKVVSRGNFRLEALRRV